MGEELIRRAKSAASAEELMAHAKESNIELTEEYAAELFVKLHAVAGELSDDELNNVAGGGCGQSMPQHKFQVGDHVRSRGYAACEGIPGFPCRSTYLVVEEKLSYYQAYSQYAYSVSCPVCHVLKQVWEDDLLPADPG